MVDSDAGTDAGTRVLIESTDGEDFWTTVGSSTNVVEASWLALADSFEYAVVLQENGKGPVSCSAERFVF